MGAKWGPLDALSGAERRPTASNHSVSPAVLVNVLVNDLAVLNSHRRGHWLHTRPIRIVLSQVNGLPVQALDEP